MKISISLSTKWTDSVLKWVVLYYTLVTLDVTARCNDKEGRCWQNALIVKRTVNVERVERSVNIDPCQWSSDDCKIQCYLHSSIYNASKEVQSIYGDRTECHSRGVSLSLHIDGINNFKANWFTANINLTELELDLSKIYRFEGSPFKAEVFSKVENLTLKSLCPCELKKITFMGLQSLETLKITNIRFDDISDIEFGALELVNGTLKTFELIEQTNQNKEISINNFIGDNSTALIIIEQVKIRYILSSINYLSFTAIPNVKVLDLADCKITNIGEFAFDSLGENLQLLNLERNMLVTLPDGIFTHLNLSPMSEQPFLKILLSENPWGCESGVEHLTQLLVDYSNFDGVVLCDTSDCPDLDPDPTDPHTTSPALTAPTTIIPTTIIPTTITLPTTAPTTTPTTDNPTTDDITAENTSPTTEFIPSFTEKQCFSSNVYEATEIVFIKRQIYPIDVTFKSNVVSVLIEINEPNLALIWFGTHKLPNDFPDSYRQSAFIGCASALQKQIELSNLERETSYTACLINMVDTTVPPLDCISFNHYGTEINDAWLYQSSKPLVIKVNVGCLLVTIIFGIAIGSIFSFRMALHSSNNNNTVSIQETIYPNEVRDLNDRENGPEECPRNGEQIYHSGFGYNRKSNSELGSLDNPPPLPPHPKSSRNCLEIDDDDDNYYATVKY